jgi:Ca2+-binding EF-hand superfamily protein
MRLLRISRILMMVPELGMMVKSLKEAARSVTSTLVLLIGIMHIVGVIFTQWAKEHENPCFVEINEGTCFLHEYFGTITKSLVTLLQILVFDNTFVLIRPILADTWYMGCLLILFMVVGSWTVLNMLIGIICQIICSGTAEEKMRILELRVKEVFSMIDSDGSGTVSRDEFNRNGVQQQLIKLGISGDIVRKCFDILDCDGSGYFDAGDFMSVVFKLLNPPQSQDIMVLNQKISEISAQMNIQAFTSHSSKHWTRGLSSRGSHAAPCEEVVIGLDADRICKSDSVIHDLRKAARCDVELLNEKWAVPALDPRGHENYHVQKDYGNATAQSIQICQGNHPFAPEDDSTDSEVVAEVAWDRHTLPVSESEQKVQVQEIYEKLQQLVHSAEKVEQALELVHGAKLWEISEAEKIDTVFNLVRPLKFSCEKLYRSRMFQQSTNATTECRE